MSKILTRAQIEAQTNEAARTLETQVALLFTAIGASHLYGNRTLTAKQWGALLRSIGMKRHKVEPLKVLLCACYPQPLDFEQWHDLFLQLAIIQNMGQ